MFVISLFIGLLFITVLYYVAKLIITRMAEQKNFFVTVKMGRIVAIKRAGRIVRYIGNLLGTGFHINEETGKREPGEAKITSLLWFLFGVRWLGLDEVYTYNFEILEIDNGGNEKITPATAESIYSTGSYLVTIDHAETSEGIPIKLVARFNLDTIDAGKSLKFPNWLIIVKDPIKSAMRDFVGSNKIANILKTKYEGEPEKTTDINDKQLELLKLILNLNNDEGNINLVELVGQHIRSFHITQIIIQDERYKERIQAPANAEKDATVMIITANAIANKRVIEATAELTASQKEAEGITAIGEANNAVLEGRVKALGGNVKDAVNIEKWKGIGGLKELRGTLVIGNSPLIFDNKDKKGGE